MPAQSKKQARCMRLVRACQETGKCLSKKIEDAAENMTVKQVQKFARTTDEEIEKKKKNEHNNTYSNFLEYFKLRKNKKCTCPCKSCKQKKDCSNCEHKNCKYEGCSCH